MEKEKGNSKKVDEGGDDDDLEQSLNWELR